MSEKQIEGQLKLSKKQNKNERYDYLCSQFNCVNYAINLEKYTNKLQKQNQKYKEVIDKAIDRLEYIIDYLEKKDMFHNYESELLDILKEVE